jgi:periplasmic copper chaperone A
MKHFAASFAAAVATTVFLASAPAFAQVKITDPWIRGTVPGQQGTGMFAQIASAQNARLLSASSPAAKVVEIHEMAMEGSVMKMRAIQALELPAGKTVELKPGGYHIMFIGLSQALKVGDTVPVNLVVEGADKKQETINLKVPVRTLAGKDHTGHGGHGGHGSKH